MSHSLNSIPAGVHQSAALAVQDSGSRWLRSLQTYHYEQVRVRDVFFRAAGVSFAPGCHVAYQAEPNVLAAVRRPVLRQAQDERKFYGAVAKETAIPEVA